MNYAALEVDELARLCPYDAGAREYVAAHFQDLIERVRDEHLQQFDEAYEIAVDQAAGAVFDQHCIAMTWRPPPYENDNPWWRIG